MVDFAGWELPLQYAGILEEHRAVRARAGLFDVSHMGDLLVTGAGAYDFLQELTTNDLARLRGGRAVYSPVCYMDGGTVDDVILYPREDGYIICCNAANTDKDYVWFSSRAASGVKVENISGRYVKVALQGPETHTILRGMGCADMAALPFFGCGDFLLAGKKVFASATGYTGEAGVELYLPPEDAPDLWDTLLWAGAKPCGLGARDTLRMEAGLPLYGHELSEAITPVMAGLSRFVKPEKGDFIGREALCRQLTSADTPKLVGLTIAGRAIPREGYAVHVDGTPGGVVTSGGIAPTLGGSIAMALMKREGVFYSIAVRGKTEDAALVELPFYKRRESTG